MLWSRPWRGRLLITLLDKMALRKLIMWNTVLHECGRLWTLLSHKISSSRAFRVLYLLMPQAFAGVYAVYINFSAWGNFSAICYFQLNWAKVAVKPLGILGNVGEARIITFFRCRSWEKVFITKISTACNHGIPSALSHTHRLPTYKTYKLGHVLALQVENHLAGVADIWTLRQY